ncbi:hypothetical protein EDD16DRAFT_1480363, partial [Pisolithus croceorrhizus]
PGMMCRRKIFNVCFDNTAAEKTAAVYGWACLFDNGPMVMTDLMLDCIINCAHHRKIQTPQDLKRETMWANSDLYTSKVLSLIERHAALHKSLIINTTAIPTVLTTPLQASASASVSASTLPTLPAKCHATKCSTCGQEGHNGKYSMLQLTSYLSLQFQLVTIYV